MTQTADALAILKYNGFPTSHGWWSRKPLRAVDELMRMVEHTNATAYARGDTIVWEELVQNNYGTSYDLEIIAGSNYPWTPPKVYAPGTTTTRHNWSDGSLCLFKPEVYSSNWTILDVRNQACSWFFAYETYKNTGSWPTAEAH